MRKDNEMKIKSVIDGKSNVEDTNILLLIGKLEGMIGRTEDGRVGRVADKDID